MAQRPMGKLMNTVMENISDAIIGIDREGKIILYNQLAATLFQKPAEAVTGKKIWDVLEISDFTRAFISMIKQSDPSPLEQILPFPGNRILLIKMIPVRGTDNRVIGAAAVLSDLTEIHKVELTVNEFVATVSHELKIPLTSIKGFVETLLEGALANPEVTRKFLQVINEETNRMTRLVISLLDLTRAMWGTGAEEVLKPIDTSRFIRESVKLFEPIAREKQINLIITVPDNLPTIQVSADKLSQVIINLVDNSMKYTGLKGPGGKVEVNAVTDGNFIRISIIDTGIGIPEEEQNKIFEKFYRVTKGPASQLGGTGLGLTITREIIQTYGGEIKVKSCPGEGSTFSFTIPIQ